MLWLLFCTVVAGNSTVYSLIRNGDFEKYSDWVIRPMSAWCDRWCGSAPLWTENAGTYILLPPKASVTATQSWNTSLLNISNYDSCDLIVHIRAVNTIDIVFNVIWAKQTTAIEWATYLSTLRNSPSEWVEMHFVLTGMSESLQFQMSTGSMSWLSLDDVSLFCSENSTFFAFDTWQIAFIVVASLIIYGALHQLYIRTGIRCRCCALCERRPQFIPLEEEVPEIEMRSVNLTDVNLPAKKRSVLEDSSEDEEEEDGKGKQRSPFIDE